MNCEVKSGTSIKGILYVVIAILCCNNIILIRCCNSTNRDRKIKGNNWNVLRRLVNGDDEKPY